MAARIFTLSLWSALLMAQQQPQKDSRPSETEQPKVESSSSQSGPADNHQAEATPLPTPAITGPLEAARPNTIEAGPLGKLDFNGVISGMGVWQSNHFAGDDTTQAAVSNGQLFIQKSSGWLQFYAQPGVYNILSLGLPFVSTETTVSDLYSPIPVAFLKLVPTKNLSVMVGALPTLMGAEYTFDFQNMNIERGLLWNQENAINRGIQVNQTVGKFTASLSWNDGFYSNRYSCLSGSLTYVNGAHSVAFSGMGNLAQTAYRTLATLVQNNGTMYALTYTYTKNKWIVQPYVQYTDVPTSAKAGVVKGASTMGGALLLTRSLSHGVSLAGRGEYIASTGHSAEQAVNLLYGPGSSAWSLTLTPTYQYQRFFARGDISFVRANGSAAGLAFGPTGNDRNQSRGVVEVGLLF
jgi:hypothetical protein